MFKSIIAAAKASPVKAALIATGTTAVIGGTIYAVRKYRKDKALAEAESAVEIVAEATQASEAEAKKTEAKA